jgi:hypothetical protein
VDKKLTIGKSEEWNRDQAVLIKNFKKIRLL